MSEVDSPGSQTFVSFDGTGHFTGVRVADPAHPGASLHSDTFTYGDSTNPDAMTTVSQGVGVSSSGYAKDTTSVDPFGVATPRLTSQTAGAAGGFNGADGSGDGTEQGTFRTSFGAMTDPNGPGSHTNTLTDARNNRTTQTFTLTGDIPSSFVSWGAIDSLTTTRPAYANAAAANSPNVTKTVYSPDMNHPTQVTVYDALWNRAPLNQKPSPWVSVYDGFDNLTSATDPLNHTWKNAYQNNLELTSTTDPTGVMWSFVYGESGAPSSRLTRIKDTTGTTRVQYGYNHFGQVNQTTIPAGASASHSAEITTIAYNEANGTGDVTGITSPLGTVTIGGYDPFGDAGSMTVYPDTGDPATSLKPLTAAVQYNAAQYVVGSTLANGVQTVNQWTNGIISGVQSYAPAPAGSAPGTLGALLTQIGFNYDSRGRLYKATDRTGNPTAQYRYDKNSNLTQIWDGLGQITKFSFGANNEPLGVKWPDNHTTTLNYDTPGRLSAATDERGVTSFYAYDVAHRLTDVTFDSGYQHEKVHRDYDEANRVLYVSDESGSRTYDYGPAGGLKRLSKIQTALASPFAPPLRYDVDYAYDPDGSVKMLVYRINGAVYTTSYVYNTAHQLQELDDPFGNVTKWTYDHAGRALTQTTTTTAQKTIRTAYTWGVSNFPGDPSTAPAYLQHIAETAAGTQAWDYELTHSYMGQVLGQTQTVSGTQTGAETYQYDPARGRLLSESQTAQTSVAASWNGAYQYDAANNVLPQNGTAAWTHNSSNQITSAPPAALSGGSGLTYDAAGSLKTFSGRSLYYDAFGRLSSAGAIYTYDAEGRRVSKTAGGATYFLYSGGMLLAEVNAFSGQVVRAYTWGALGLISDSADRPIDPANPAPSAFVTVSGKAILEGAGSFAAGMTLHCTLVSTRQNVSLITRDVTLDGSGAFSLPNVPADAYVLSVKADRWLRTNVPIDASGGDVTTITAWLSAGDADNDNSVDSSDFGILIGAMDTEADVPDSGYDVHADFNNDGFVDSNDFGLLIGNFNVTGAALPASFVAGTPLPAPDRFYLFDGLGNTRSVVDSGGNVVWRGAWSAWGSPLAGAALDSAFGWKGQYGQYRDSETGLVYCKARYYAPSLGRFISRDPIGFSGGINLYAYCNDDPVNYADPLGRDGYFAQAWGFFKGECSALNPVNMAKGLYGLEESCLDDYLDNGLRGKPYADAISKMGDSLAFWNKDDAEQAGQGFMGCVLIATPAIKRIPLSFASATETMAIAEATSTPLTTVAYIQKAASVCINTMLGPAEPMQVVEYISKGTSLDSIAGTLKELTYLNDVEHAVVRFSDGTRAIVSGGKYGIEFPPSVTRLIAHTHPYTLPPTGPSSADLSALGDLGQGSSYLLEHGDITKFYK